MKRILIGTLAVMMVMPVMADDEPTVGDKTTTSQPYVETQVGLKQGLIPAAGTNSATAGSTVVTYTATSGEIGERELFTGGEYTAGTDADKLITASALNSAFTTLPETPTTTLECANPGTCTLWTIIDQTAYAAGGGSGGTDPAVLAMLHALIITNGSTGYCYKRLIDGTGSAGSCTTTPSNYGDWGVMFDYNGERIQVSGISACSTVDEGLSMGDIPTNQTGVQSDYESNMSNAPTDSPVGAKCYCKMTGPAVSRWVFAGSRSSSSSCADYCAYNCGGYVRGRAGFRSDVFGAVQ